MKDMKAPRICWLLYVGFVFFIFHEMLKKRVEIRLIEHD